MSVFKKKRIPTLIGLFLLIGSVILGISLINQRQIFRLQAKDETTPKNVRVSNISDSSFSISWTTDYETKGFVKWGDKEKSPSSTALDTINSDNKSKNHYLTLENLVSNNNYYFVINSEGTDYNSNGLAWQVQTGKTLPPPTNSKIIYGTILNPSGQPERKALVYVSAGGGSTLSTTTGDDGTWVISLSVTRSKDLGSYVSIDDNKTIAEISAQSGNLITVATIYPVAATPIPPMTLGQTYDFKNLTGENLGNIPQASIEISPENSAVLTPTPNLEKSVSLDNPKEGEAFTSSFIEFNGGGPPGKPITITVESEVPMVGNTKADSGGSWTWSPPQDLDPGEHSVTVSWTDENGVVKNIKRQFTVQAASVPSTSPSLAPTASSIPQSNQVTKNAKSTIGPNFLGLSGLNLIEVSTVAVLTIIFLLVFTIRRKSQRASAPQDVTQGSINAEPSKNRGVGSGGKIFLILGTVVLIAAGAFSLYQLYKSKQAEIKSGGQIAQVPPAYPTPTTPPSQRLTETVALPSPTPYIPIVSPTTFVQQTIIPSPTPTVAPTAIPMPTTTPTSILSPSPKLTVPVTTPTPTVAPTAIPTIRVTPTLIPSPIAQTQLPSAGFTLPTLTLGGFGILLLILSFALIL